MYVTVIADKRESADKLEASRVMKNYLIYLFLHEEHKMPRQHTLRPMSRYFFVRLIRCGLHGARFNDHGSSCDLGDMQDGARPLQCLDPNFSGNEC